MFFNKDLHVVLLPDQDLLEEMMTDSRFNMSQHIVSPILCDKKSRLSPNTILTTLPLTIKVPRKVAMRSRSPPSACVVSENGGMGGKRRMDLRCHLYSHLRILSAQLHLSNDASVTLATGSL